MTLSYSRAVYVRFFYSMRMNEFLQGHVEAFEYFEGVPRQILHDNLKTGVSERLGSMVRFNDTFLNFASIYGFAPRAANVRRGNEKGRVERSIQYIRTSFFEGRQFTNIDELNAKALEWCQQIALDRPWPQDKTIKVKDAFCKEKTLLPKIPDNRFPCLDIVEVSVGKTPYVRFDSNDYSVPSRHVGTVLELRASEKSVEIFESTNAFEPVAKHSRTYGKSEVVEDSDHLAELHKRKKAANQHATMHRLTNEIKGVEEFLQRLAERGESLGGAVSSLNRMCDIHGSAIVSQALSEVILNGTCNLKSIHFILNRLDSKSSEPRLSFAPLNNQSHSLLTVRHHELKSYDTITGVKTNEPVGR